jgi:hypothetical protein
MRSRRKDPDGFDLRALQNLYSALGPALSAQVQRIFAGDGSPTSEQWYVRLHCGRATMSPLPTQPRLASDDITPERLFLLPPNWELARIVLTALDGEGTSRGDLFSAEGDYYCRLRSGSDVDSLPFLHLWTMCNGRALRFESFLGRFALRRAGTLDGCLAKF